jgi:hypothetical protein
MRSALTAGLSQEVPELRNDEGPVCKGVVIAMDVDVDGLAGRQVEPLADGLPQL